MNKVQIDRLFQNGIFPENDSAKKLVETGISWVIIGKKYVYKIKKPVKYSYLDYSIVGKRKFFCEEEVRLNRRLTKDIYLDVLPIFRKKDTFVIGENGKRPIDYLVWMRKMNPLKQMDYMLNKNKVSNEYIKKLASQVNRFHSETKRIYSPFDRKGMEENFNDIRTIRDFVKVYMRKTYLQKMDFSIVKARSFVRQNVQLFRNRVERGFVRDCHGDMHSRNIFLYKKPVIFDCIEFDKKLRHIDVLNEIAFLCMDLEAFHKPELSNYFLRNYNQSDTEGVLNKLFIYYKCLHANVRAKVNALHAIEEENPAIFRKCVKQTADYINLMYSYAQLLNV